MIGKIVKGAVVFLGVWAAVSLGLAYGFVNLVNPNALGETIISLAAFVVGLYVANWVTDGRGRASK